MATRETAGSVEHLTIRFAEILTAHEWRGTVLGCRCGWNWPHELTGSCGEEDRITATHIQHVAEALADEPNN